MVRGLDQAAGLPDLDLRLPERRRRFTAPADGSYTFETLESWQYPFDSVLSLHSACPTAGGSHELVCSDDAGSSFWSSVSYPMSEGEQVLVRISGYGGDQGYYALRVTEARTVQGRVTRSGDGAPLAGIEIEISTQYGGIGSTGLTGADGTFSVSVPGEYGPYHGFARNPLYRSQIYDGIPCNPDCFTHFADPIEVADGDVSGIDFVLEPAGTITGTVTGGDTSDTLGAVHVSLYKDDDTYSDSVYTDAAGTYRFESLPPGNYGVLTRKTGYQSEVWDDNPCGPVCSYLSGDLVTVTGEATTFGIDFHLERLPKMTGRVTRADDEQPIFYASVRLYDDEGTLITADSTDSNGDYQMSWREPGDHFAVTSTIHYFDELYDGFTCEPDCDSTTGTPITTSFNDRTAGIDFALTPMASISGRVTDAASGLGAYARVYLYDATGEYVLSRLADYPDYDYIFEGLEAGTYYVRAGFDTYDYPANYEGQLYDGEPCPSGCEVTTGTPVTVGASTQRTGIDFSMVRRGRLSGRVLAAGTGAPLYDISVVAYRADGTAVKGDRTGSDGRYEIQYLPAGTYRVGTSTLRYADEMYDDVPCDIPTCDRTTGIGVVVESDQETSGIDFAIRALGRLSGSVFDASNGGTVYAYARLYDAAGEPLDWDSGWGGFLLDGVAPGTYYLQVGNQGDDVEYQDEVYANLPCSPDCDVTRGTPLHVEVGTDLTGLDFYLARCPADSWLEIVSTSITGYYKGLACDQITTSDTTLEPGADLLLRSGRSVVFGDGFSMEPGARLRVVIDPAWADD